MKIAVCIKQVPDSGAVSLDPVTHTLVRASVGVMINPLDEFPLETAVKLKEKCGGTVTAITMGPPRAEEVLARAIAAGADDGILLSDAKFAGGDTWATSLVLAKALEKTGPYDLIFFGKQAIDGDTAQVGPETAAHLGLPQASSVNNVFMPESSTVSSLKVSRLFEEGSDVVEIPLPAVLMVLKEAAEPRFGTMEGRLDYYRKGVRKMNFADLEMPDGSSGLKGSPTRVAKTTIPKSSRQQRRLSGSPSEMAAELASIIRSIK